MEAISALIPLTVIGFFTLCGGLAFLVPVDRNVTKHPNLPVPDDTSEALEPGQLTMRR